MAKILIVDDDHELVALLTEILKRDGHAVRSASEPVEGMQKCRAETPDLIILDFHMPGTDGAHLFESLRRNQASRETPILFLSGEAAPEQILDKITDTSHSQFLAKPIHVDQLRHTVREMLEHG
ncbi:MAG: response regulator [Elusimicrobia bacterium]|nr:response regulator [Elusimicrobiota bacterium]